MLILFYILACICTTQGKVRVTEMGVSALVRGDTGIIFYLTLENIGDFTYDLNVKMVKCCEVFDENDMDCQIMKLIGGDMGFLYEGQVKNVTLLYPNMYIHNRRGKCLICIKYHSTEKKNCTIEAKEKIKFDTYITGETSNKSALRGYYKSYEYSKCQSIDQDPLSSCEPVNCQMKYLGYRNYFNVKWQRCQKVPACVSDPTKLLPDVAYVPMSNTCVDLENVIIPQDLRYLEEGVIEGILSSMVSTLPQANLRCHHGHYNNYTGICQCDEGWMSSLYHKDFFEPSLGIYHMCNVQISTWNKANAVKIRMTLFVIGVLGAVMAVSTIITALVCHLLYKCIGPSKSLKNKVSCTDSLGSTKSTESTNEATNTVPPTTQTSDSILNENQNTHLTESLQSENSDERDEFDGDRVSVQEQTAEIESVSNEENVTNESTDTQ